MNSTKPRASSKPATEDHRTAAGLFQMGLGNPVPVRPHPSQREDKTPGLLATRLMRRDDCGPLGEGQGVHIYGLIKTNTACCVWVLGRGCLEPEGHPRVGDRAGECRGCGIHEGEVINCVNHCRETEDT